MALEQGAVEKLIVWENLDIKRYVLRNPQTESKIKFWLFFEFDFFYFFQFCFLAEETKYLRPDQERDRTFFIDKATGVELETVESTQFLDWLVDTDESNQPNYKQYGTTLEIVTDRSQEGAQFVKGFGGIGGELDFLF